MNGKMGESGKASGWLLPAVIIGALAVAAAGAGYVAAQTILGHGDLTVNIVSAQYAVDVKFYSDSNATNQISSVDIPLGGSQVVYAKLTNTSNSDYMNLYVQGGGQNLWMNVYKLDGTPLYQDGQVKGTFNLAKGQSIVVKVQVGTLPGASVGDTLTLGLDVLKD